MVLFFLQVIFRAVGRVAANYVQMSLKGVRYFGLVKLDAWRVPIKTHTNLVRMLHSV